MNAEPSPVAAASDAPSMIDFPGRLAALVFTAGCPFACGYCHNIVLCDPSIPRWTWADVDERIGHWKAQWVDAVVVGGGEPTIHGDGLDRLIDRCREAGLAVKLDTNGAFPDVLARLIDRVDYIAMDVKTAPSRHAEWTGWADVSALSESIRLIRASGRLHEFRTTVVRSHHTPEVMDELAGWLDGAEPWVLQPFVPRETLTDARLRTEPRTPRDYLYLLHERLRPRFPVEIRGTRSST